MSQVQLIAGLGNPGPQYEKTRHNLGFMLVDALYASAAEKSQAGAWRERSGALVSEVRVGSERLLLVKPQTFMNRSGEPLVQVMQFYKVAASGIAVLHDEVDIPLGALRIKQGGGDGGHNGIKSVAQSLGTPEFVRFRLGIGRPPIPPGVDAANVQRPDGVSNWVLGRFAQEELAVIKELLTRATLALETLGAEGIKAAQNRFNS